MPAILLLQPSRSVEFASRGSRGEDRDPLRLAMPRRRRPRHDFERALLDGSAASIDGDRARALARRSFLASLGSAARLAAGAADASAATDARRGL